MDQKDKIGGFTPQEQIISVLPAAVAGIFLLLATVVTALLEFGLASTLARDALFAYGLLGSLYLAFFHLLYLPQQNHKAAYAWVNALVSGLGLGLIHMMLPQSMDPILGLLLLAATISSATVSERPQTYLLLAIAATLKVLIRQAGILAMPGATYDMGLIVMCVVLIETVLRLRSLARRQIQRLEMVNEFSRQISSSLDRKQVLSLLNATIQNALQADSYYVGLLEKDEIYLSLLYDDGEYFHGIRVKLDGTLSGWVIKNNKELFLPDLRTEVDLPGVQRVIIGKDRTSLSWMGVPMYGESALGVLAIGSYRPHAFDRGDMELLSNMARHAALALDNAFRHGQVEEQSHLDSLTGAYNHGHFLRLLAELGDASRNSGQLLSVIMLDVDHFKHYNDTYGHLAGDGVLTALCATIKRYLKRSDIVGRWGGEEFAIALPGASGNQAQQVADRIRETMSALVITSYQEKTFPVPTVSQGIAEFPTEAGDGIRLIDLADHRLYVAKERGRDQVEPEASHWTRMPSRGRPAASAPDEARI